MALKIKSRQECSYDMATLDEVFLRLDAGQNRIRRAPWFQVDACGDGFDAARGLSKCFGLATTVITALADDDIGQLISEIICSGNVDISFIKWTPNAGRLVTRNSILFAERGFGLRCGRNVIDNIEAAASHLQPFDIDWTRLFTCQGVRWFHTESRFATLSETAAQAALAATRAAKRSGSVVSYAITDHDAMKQSANIEDIHKEIARNVDVLIGSSTALATGLGIVMPEATDAESYECTFVAVKKAYPQVQIIASPLYREHGASVCDWAAVAWDGSHLLQSIQYENLTVYDHTGLASAFIAGLFYGLLEADDLQTALDYGVAHGTLVMTTPQSASCVDLNEVKALMQAKGSLVRDQAAQWSLVGWSSGEW